MILAGRAFEKKLDHEGRDFKNGFSAFTKEAKERPLAFSSMRGHSEKLLPMNQNRPSRDTVPASILLLDIPALEL